MKKKIIGLFALISAFVFIVSISTLYVQIEILKGNPLTCTFPVTLLIPTLSSLGLFIGLTVYYFIPSPKEKCEKLFNFFLNFLENEEREIVKMIIENGGEISQAKISRKIGKVKTFRGIEKLRKKGMIEKIKHGKTNKIMLKKEIKEILGI